jgi:hypothetical protein
MPDWLIWLTGGGGLVVTLGSVVVALGSAVCATVIPLVIIGGVVVFLVRRSKKATAVRQAAQAWASTTGTVLMSTIQVRRTAQSRSEIPVVVYHFVVNGQPYQGQTVRAGDQFFSMRMMGQARDTVARYPAGATVTVYYNPANPAESALER